MHALLARFKKHAIWDLVIQDQNSTPDQLYQLYLNPGIALLCTPQISSSR